MNAPDWLFMVLCAASMVLLVWGLNGVWKQYLRPNQRVLAERLKSTPASPASSTQILRKKRLLSQTPWLEKGLLSLPGILKFDRFLLQTGLAITTGQALLLMGSALLFTVCLVFWFGLPAWLGTALLLVAAALPLLFFQHRRQQRVAHIQQQMPDALGLIARAMQAGHAFTSALKIAAKDSPAPLSLEVRKVFDEINFGISTAQALQNLSARIASEDVRFFVVAVVLQNETGGNLAEILKNTASLIRERQKMAGVIRVLSAEGRVSALILSVLPFALAGALSWLNPAFISKLWTDPMGLQLVYFSLGLMALGIVWMWKLIQIRV